MTLSVFLHAHSSMPWQVWTAHADVRAKPVEAMMFVMLAAKAGQTCATPDLRRN
jgi:hypothetical protein